MSHGVAFIFEAGKSCFSIRYTDIWKTRKPLEDVCFIKGTQLHMHEKNRRTEQLYNENDLKNTSFKKSQTTRLPLD